MGLEGLLLCIVPLYDFWREPDNALLALRWLRGGSLEKAAESWPLDAKRVVAILDQIADALSAAHQGGAVHRDLKPSNILLDEQGKAYIMDFGLAVDLAIDASGSASGFFGSPAYIAPEQVRKGLLSTQTDIYSLGVVLYELLTGVHPFAEEALTSLLYKHVHEPLPQATAPTRSVCPLELCGSVRSESARSRMLNSSAPVPMRSRIHSAHVCPSLH